MKYILTLALFTLLLSACPKVSNQISYNLGESIMIPMQESVTIGSEKITLLMTKVEESRCPKGTNCIQPGEAKIMINFAKGDAVSEVKLNAKGLCQEEGGKCGNSVSVQGYQVKLFFLYPYPESGQGKDKKYVAKVMVTKGGGLTK